MSNGLDVENAIISLSELNNLVQFIDRHSYDLTDADSAVGMLHLIAGQLDARTKALSLAYYGERNEKERTFACGTFGVLRIVAL